MKTKLLFFAVGVLLILLSLNIHGITAQEPTGTQEPDQASAVIVSGEHDPQTLPPADVVVIQPEVVEEKDTIAGVIEKLTVPLIAIAGFVMLMLSTRNREKVRGVGEVVEDIAWATTLGATELITAFGGNPNVVVSTDPKALAAALKDGGKHVLIRQGVSFDSIVKEYTAPPAV